MAVKMNVTGTATPEHQRVWNQKRKSWWLKSYGVLQGGNGVGWGVGDGFFRVLDHNESF